MDELQVFNDYLNFSELDESLKTRETCLQAVQRYGRALEFVPENIKDEEICMAAITRDGFNLKFVPEKYKTKQVCLKAIESNGVAIHFVPKSMLTLEFCLEIGHISPFCIIHMPEQYKDAVLKSF